MEGFFRRSEGPHRRIAIAIDVSPAHHYNGHAVKTRRSPFRKPRKSSPRPTRGEGKALTRQRIIQAAVEVFAREGYHGALMDEIARQSGTSKGAVYFHFPTKEALFTALVDEFASRLAVQVAEAIEGAKGAVGKVEAALGAGLAVFHRNRDLAKILLLDSTSLGPAYQLKRAEIHGRFAALIQYYLSRAAEEGSIPPLDVHITTYAWLGAINEVVIQWLTLGQPRDLLAAGGKLSTLLLRSIGAKAG